MKRYPMGIVLGWLVWFGWAASLSMPAAWAYDAYHDVYYQPDYDQHFNRLLDRSKFQRLGKSVVQRIQQDLATVYQNDLNWKRDMRLSQQPLTDAVMGPVTLFWLQRFAHDFKIAPVGDYAGELIVRLEKMAEFADMFPEETGILLSPGLAAWNDTEPGIQRDLDYDIRRMGSHQELLDLVYRYLAVMEPLQQMVTEDYAASPLYFYQLTAADFEILNNRGQIIETLSKLENKPFDNFAMLEEALAGIFQAYPKFLARLSPAIKKFYRDKPLVLTTEFIAFIDLAMAGDPFIPVLNKTLSGLLEKELLDAAYPNQTLFDKAAQAKIFAATGVCVSTRMHNQYVLSLKLDDDAFLDLETDLLNNREYHGMPEIRKHLKLINALRQGERHCEEKDRQTVQDFVTNLYEHAVLPAIDLLYKKRIDFNAAASIDWDGGGCGCVLDKLSGTVYGFYPFWLAGSEKQTVNFSVLTRVAYYGLSFDAKGSLIHANDPENRFDLKSFLKKNPFIETARKHNSKVDWVIHKDQSYWETTWKQLDSSQKANILTILSDSILDLLTRPLDKNLSKWTFGVLPLPTQGDGVTLDFRGFPQDAVSVGLFNHFYDNLRTRLSAVRDDYFVNIMLPQSDLGKGVYRHFNLLERISGIKPNDSPTSYQQLDIRDNLGAKILVLIEEPTTYAKKNLRLDVESGGLYGILRGLLLRNIIPVIEYSGGNWEQLEDDIVYFKDNFGGAGFWSMPLDEPAMPEQLSGRCEDIKTIGGCLVRHFQEEQRNGQPDSALDRFVCENRLYFWVVLAVLIVLLFILATILRRNCQFSSKKRNIMVMTIFATVIPALVAALLLLLYDPMMEKLAEGNIPLIAVVTAGLFASILIYRRQQSKSRKPSRPKRTSLPGRTGNRATQSRTA